MNLGRHGSDNTWDGYFLRPLVAARAVGEASVVPQHLQHTGESGRAPWYDNRKEKAIVHQGLPRLGALSDLVHRRRR